MQMKKNMYYYNRRRIKIIYPHEIQVLFKKYTYTYPSRKSRGNLCNVKSKRPV